MLRDLATKRGETLAAEVLIGELRVDLLFVDISRVAEVGIGGMAVTKVRGFGRQKGRTEPYHGGSFGITFLPKVKLKVVVSDNNATRVTKLIERCRPSRSSFAWQAEGTNELRSVGHKTIRQTARPLDRPRESLASFTGFSDQLHI
jgi:hypothetical protein